MYNADMSHLPISVHVLTKNSAKTLERCLQSVHGCAQILIIDGGSTDTTLEIAKRHGAKIIAQPASALQRSAIRDFAAVRNVGLAAATQPWILALDSDEEASEELMEEIRKTMQQYSNGGMQQSAFWIPRRYRLPSGELVVHATTYPNERIYLFRKDAAEEWVKPVHERVRFRPATTIGRLRGWTIADLGTVAEYKEKNRRYLALERERSQHLGWIAWIGRVLRTVRSRLIAILKLAWIWLLPHRGKRLPLTQEWARFWYAWRLVVETFPLRHR
jgi:glycosyltransferase involved in cell wall biosynthesis